MSRNLPSKKIMAVILYGHYFFSSMIFISLSFGIVFLPKCLSKTLNEKTIFVSLKKQYVGIVRHIETY